MDDNGTVDDYIYFHTVIKNMLVEADKSLTKIKNEIY